MFLSLKQTLNFTSVDKRILSCPTECDFHIKRRKKNVKSYLKRDSQFLSQGTHPGQASLIVGATSSNIDVHSRSFQLGFLPEKRGDANLNLVEIAKIQRERFI